MSSLLYAGATNNYINKTANTWSAANLEKTNFNITRVRRGIKVKTSEPCCGEAFYTCDTFKEEMKECQAQNDNYGKKDDILICLYECVGRKLDLVDEEGFIKKEKFIEFCPKFVEGDRGLQALVEQIARENVVSAVNKASKGVFINFAFVII
ncbi:hypothetical protein C0J52_27708 [Blattella germanica]|nr:hypothetical protein C0J52_27708 [Blattella germanica]